MSGVFRHELTVSDPLVLAPLGERTGMRFGYDSADPGFSYHLSRAGDERLAMSRVQVGGTMSLWGDTETFTIATVSGARYDWQTRHHTGSAAQAGAVLFRPDHPALVVMEEVDVRLVHLPVHVVEATASTVYGTQTPVAFDFPAPGTAELGRYWRSLVGYGTDLLAAGAFEEPLVRAELTRQLAVGLLECFPLAGDRHERYLSMEAQAARYRIAVAFFDDHAATPITVEDAARAAGTTTAALVRAFRANHPLGLTPAQYLRRVRLDGAHADLQAGYPTAGNTVRSIAARWGFTHPGRFAQYYRQVYGISPRHTLER